MEGYPRIVYALFTERIAHPFTNYSNVSHIFGALVHKIVTHDCDHNGQDVRQGSSKLFNALSWHGRLVDTPLVYSPRT